MSERPPPAQSVDQWRNSMSKFILTGAFIGLSCVGIALWPALSADDATVPDFSSNNVAWDGGGENEFTTPKSGPGPVTSDPAHPYISNFRAARTGERANWRVADLSNPILKPWVVDALRKANEDALAGKAMFTREARCWATGVPAMLLNPGRLHFVQTPKQVWILQQSDHRVRRIYLNRPHSANLKPTWYGESVGHYEGGDTLVVDTVGMNDRTFVDSYRTPHTAQIHVVERFKLIDGGKMLEANFTVDDPGAFNMPWSAGKRWRRVQGTLEEDACAENNENYFNYDIEPMPIAHKPEF
jgi:hypothetical protein